MTKFNKKLQKDIDDYNSSSISEEDKEKLAKLKGRLEHIEEQKMKLKEDKFYIDVARELLQDSGIKTKIVTSSSLLRTVFLDWQAYALIH